MAEEAKSGPARRLPEWLKKRLPSGPEAAQVRQMLAELGLATVCASAHCPNISECFARRTATFLILGDRCTRNCRFCAVTHAAPLPLRPDEPQAVAQAARRLSLQHVVITSVTRDDLPDGGAAHFARTILSVRQELPASVVEVLTPDFQGRHEDVDTVLQAGPEIFNHNIETVPRLYPFVRPQADYRQSLGVLHHAATRQALRRIHTKSGLMLGLGETPGEIAAVLADLRQVGCEILTLGQYLAPSASHAPVERFVPPGEFEQLRGQALAMGFASVAAGPFVRSSYHAQQVYQDTQVDDSNHKGHQEH